MVPPFCLILVTQKPSSTTGVDKVRFTGSTIAVDKVRFTGATTGVDTVRLTGSAARIYPVHLFERQVITKGALEAPLVWLYACSIV
jgi:hypothetical protein